MGMSMLAQHAEALHRVAQAFRRIGGGSNYGGGFIVENPLNKNYGRTVNLPVYQDTPDRPGYARRIGYLRIDSLGHISMPGPLRRLLGKV